MTPTTEVRKLWPDVELPARQRLLAAGLTLFTEHGFHGTSTRAISLEAGMSSAALYVHYPTKNDLLFDITHTGHLSVLRAVRSSLSVDERDSVGRLRSFVEAFARWHAEHAAVARVVQYEWEWLEPAQRRKVRRLRHEVEGLLADELRAGQQSGQLSVDDVRLTALAILSLNIDISRWFNAVRDIDADTVSAGYARLCLRMVGVRPEALRAG